MGGVGANKESGSRLPANDEESTGVVGTRGTLPAFRSLAREARARQQRGHAPDVQADGATDAAGFQEGVSNRKLAGRRRVQVTSGTLAPACLIGEEFAGTLVRPR